MGKLLQGLFNVGKEIVTKISEDIKQNSDNNRYQRDNVSQQNYVPQQSTSMQQGSSQGSSYGREQTYTGNSAPTELKTYELTVSNGINYAECRVEFYLFEEDSPYADEDGTAYYDFVYQMDAILEKTWASHEFAMVTYEYNQPLSSDKPVNHNSLLPTISITREEPYFGDKEANDRYISRLYKLLHSTLEKVDHPIIKYRYSVNLENENYVYYLFKMAEVQLSFSIELYVPREYRDTYVEGYLHKVIDAMAYSLRFEQKEKSDFA